MLISGPDGRVAGALMECPHCGIYEVHATKSPGDVDHFECAWCFAVFTQLP
jgi:hypothetical protein